MLISHNSFTNVFIMTRNQCQWSVLTEILKFWPRNSLLYMCVIPWNATNWQTFDGFCRSGCNFIFRCSVAWKLFKMVWFYEYISWKFISNWYLELSVGKLSIYFFCVNNHWLKLWYFYWIMSCIFTMSHPRI